MQKPVACGIIGLGFGLNHVRTLANLGEGTVAAIADLKHPELETIASRYGAQFYRDGLSLVADPQVEALILATSPVYREPILEAAAQRGLPVFVEKPWASDLEHARRLAEICEKNSAPVMPGFSFRFHPPITRARELIQGNLGSPQQLQASYVFNWLPPADNWLWDPKNGNGFFNENSCHLFDAVFALAGRPATVFAVGSSFGGRPSADSAAIIIQFANGAIGTLNVGGMAKGAFVDFPKMDLICAHGSLRLQGRHHIWERIEWSAENEATAQSFTAPVEALGETRYSAALRHFLICVRENRPPDSTLAEAVTTMAFIEALHQSLREARPIDLPAF